MVQGRAHQGPGPDGRAKRPLDSSLYINGVLGPEALGQLLHEILVSGDPNLYFDGLFLDVIQYNVKIFFCGGLRRQHFLFLCFSMSRVLDN